jgi:glycosyltransferase involved in cell wall biosynthesis
LCPPDDPAALAEVLRQVLGDPVLRARLGQAARDRLRREFSVDALVDRHIARYAVTVRARRRQLG